MNEAKASNKLNINNDKRIPMGDTRKSGREKSWASTTNHSKIAMYNIMTMRFNSLYFSILFLIYTKQTNGVVYIEFDAVVFNPNISNDVKAKG